MNKVMLLALVPLAACSMASGSDNGGGVPASGGGTARSYAINGFTAVKLTGSDNVVVRVGQGFSVNATGPSDILDRLKIEKDGDTLKIGRRSHSGFSWGSSKSATITVTMPALNAAAVTGSGDMSVDRVKANELKLAATGSGDLAVETIEVQNGSFSITGSGSIRAGGTAQALDLSVTGSGDIDAQRLTARSASVSVMGSGSANATVDGEATVSIMGSGDVDLGPKAHCKTSKMGSGDVRCGN